MIVVRNIIVLVVLIFLTNSLCSKAPQLYRTDHSIQNKNQNKNQLMCICIPKCGTHLLKKCLALFKLPGIHFNYKKDLSKPSAKRLEKMRRLNKIGPPYHFKGLFYLPEVGQVPKGLVARMRRAKKTRSFWWHWPHTEQFARFLASRTYANFLIIRDPRDMVVSFAHMIATARDGRKIELRDIIADLITGQQKHFVPWASEIQEAYPILWELGLYDFYRLYLPWIKEKNFMLVRFEDLIGSLGGGSVETQMDTIRSIAYHIGYDIQQEQLNEVMNSLFGGTWTFREGKSAAWKKHFTPEIKALFQNDKRLMQLLIDVGYEKDFSW